MLKKIIKISIAIFMVVFLINIIYFSFNEPNVAVIELKGIITPQKANSIIKEIKKAREENSIKAVLFKIDSPGGEACSSQRIYLALKKLSKSKPTVALIETVGASGAYFAACGADKIVAYPASIVGSIGVIFETLNFAQLSKRLGLSLFVVKTGKVKDVGNPFREPTEADRKMIKNLIDSIYSQFLKAVSSSRKISLDSVKRIADGSVFTGAQALKLKLIDSTEGEPSAKRYLKKLAHLKKIKYEKLSDDGSLRQKFTNILYIAELLSILSHPTAKAIYQ